MKKSEEMVFDTSYTYDPIKDIAPVDQFGFVDLRSAFVNGTIPGDLVVRQEDYNGVEDPASLIGRSLDVFDALRKASYVKDAESAAAAAKGTEVTAASSAAAE